jgi:cell division protein FtsX
MSKAVEIAWKSIRLRLSRSLLVTSGIVLALAFLMSILTSEAFISGMRGWIENPGISVSKEEQQTLADSLRQKRTAVQEAVAASQKKKPKADETWKAKEEFGAPLADIQQELSLPLPLTAADLEKAMAADKALIPVFNDWLETARHLKAVQDERTAPQRLQALMEKNGVPSDPVAIAQSQIQTRWLIGLALLVAFVGILNAMLMSVTERFREIGTMKCLGALDGFIIKLFLIESLFQGIVGTIVGVLVGLLLSMAAASIGYGAFAWKNVQWHQIGVATVICLVVGVVLTVAGALYPSWRAARMQPIEAMRVDT